MRTKSYVYHYHSLSLSKTTRATNRLLRGAEPTPRLQIIHWCDSQITLFGLHSGWCEWQLLHSKMEQTKYALAHNQLHSPYWPPMKKTNLSTVLHITQGFLWWVEFILNLPSITSTAAKSSPLQPGVDRRFCVHTVTCASVPTCRIMSAPMTLGQVWL